MRIRLDLDPETTKKLVAMALAERRSASDQAAVILEEALGLRISPMVRLEPPELTQRDLQEKG